MGRSDISGTGFPLGRPKWHKTTTLAPRLASCEMVRAPRSIRVCSVICPSFIGTLKSAWTSTRLPATSNSSMVRNFLTAGDFTRGTLAELPGFAMRCRPMFRCAGANDDPAGKGPMQQTAQRELSPWLKSYPPGIDWGAEIAVKPMHALMDDAAAGLPISPASIFSTAATVMPRSAGW